MRYVLVCFLAGAAGLFLTQSSELHNRFGEPTAESFNAAPGISLAAQYGSDHSVCQALLQAPQALLHGEEPVPN